MSAPAAAPLGGGAAAAAPAFAAPATSVSCCGGGGSWCGGGGGRRAAVFQRRPAAAAPVTYPDDGGGGGPRRRRCRVGTRSFPTATADSVGRADGDGGSGRGGGGGGGSSKGDANPWAAAADAWEADTAAAAAAAPSLARPPPPAASAVARSRRKGVPPPAASAAEWEALIEEFERRADAAAGASSSSAGPAGRVDGADDDDEDEDERHGPAGWQPPGGGSGLPAVENPEQYVQLPTVEAALMAAVGCCLWSLGRVYRLDSFLLLLYPLPPVFVALRWDTRRAVQTVGVTVMLVGCSLGPLYAFLYALGIGSLSVVMATGLAARWPTALLLAATTATKVAGVAAQVSIAARLLGFGGWSMITAQVRGMLAGLGVVAAKAGLVGAGGWPAPSARTVAVAVGGVLGVHSALLCFFSAATCMMLADATADWGYLPRRPRMMWFLAALKRNATRAGAERGVRSSAGGGGSRRRRKRRRV